MSSAECAADESGDTTATSLSALTTLTYLMMYTGHDVKTNKLSLSLIFDVLLVRRSREFTLVELDALLSLSGLTVLGFAFWPRNKQNRHAFICHALYILLAHAAYVAYLAFKRYMSEGSMLPSLGPRGNKSVKQISLAAGAFGLLMLTMTYFEWAVSDAGGLLALMAFSAHFYTQSIDKHGTLQLRSFGHAAMYIVWIGLAWWATEENVIRAMIPGTMRTSEYSSGGPPLRGRGNVRGAAKR